MTRPISNAFAILVIPKTEFSALSKSLSDKIDSFINVISSKIEYIELSIEEKRVLNNSLIVSIIILE